MSDIDKIECRACGRLVDPHARVCLYCDADPRTGAAQRRRPEIDELITPKPDQSPVEKVATTLRSRGGVVLAASIVIGLVLLIAVSTWVNQRQRTMVADVPPVPLTEVTDLSATREGEEPQELELPELTFEFDGEASAMETFVLEEGAVAPLPEPGDGGQESGPGSQGSGARNPDS